jgi:hypothetical protein
VGFLVVGCLVIGREVGGREVGGEVVGREVGGEVVGREVVGWQVSIEVSKRSPGCGFLCSFDSTIPYRSREACDLRVVFSTSLIVG